jgi:hypothetical protein
MKTPLPTYGIALAAIMMMTTTASSYAQANAAPGTTRVATWKDDKKASFLLMFDDSIPTDIHIVIPELQKRGMIGTFYVNPASGQWKAFPEDWEKKIPATGMVYGDHTMTHKGYQDLQGAENEIGKCCDIILKLQSGRDPHLLSYGIPGGCPLKITPEEYSELLVKYHLIERPPFSGHAATINLKDAASILNLADDAIAKGGVNYVVFHGVGGDWIVFPADEFIKVLDGLAARKDQLWITDHISEHKYATERYTAKTEVTQASDQQIQLTLKCSADPALYDFPLTLVTRVPAAWQGCEVTQGKNKSTVVAQNGEVRYDALPGSDSISLTPAAVPIK